MENKAVAENKLTGIIKALTAAYVITAVILLLIAFLLYQFDLGEQQVRFGIMAAYVLSTFTGGFLAGKVMEIRRFLWGFGIGVLYFGLLAALSFVVYHSVQAGGNVILAFLLCVAGGTLGGMVS